MRVLIDARVSMGGIERNIQALLPFLEKALPEGDLAVFGRSWPPAASISTGMTGPRKRGFLRSALGHIKRIVVDRMALPRAAARSGAEIVHLPVGFASRGIRVPIVAHVHDLWLMDGFKAKKPGMMKYYERAAALAALNRAARLIVPTDAVARQIAERFEFAAERVRVIYGPLVEFPAPAPLPGGLGDRLADGFFLSVGTVEPRKNLEGLIDAHRIACKRCGLPLVVAGGYGWRQETFVQRAAESAGRVVWLGFVDDATLAGLYARATALVQLSLDEGFSYPVSEAMGFGVPMALSDIEAHREVARDLALYAPPTDVEAAADRMTTVAGWSTETRARHAERAHARLDEIRYRGRAELYLDVYRECLE
ncbi:glycosyltransferase family 4 protein [Candidatus Sumerlaeota bacterium]|nr:glycosyltransferase family 4 protein [Candidatus Sumerlaeota bacterium]